MGDSYDLDDVDLLTAGTVGPPGERVFYLQARRGSELLTLKVEKTQVAALVRYLGTLLADLPPPEELPPNLELVEPIEPKWVVGTLGVSYDEDADRFVLLAEELVEEGEDGAMARIGATRDQIAGLVLRGAELVDAGRPPCPFCGLPLDPAGHICPRANGHLH
ncbi:MAG: DUF3090 family protein [Acidimicrobiia bacterium]|nr:DUF3090 family protein [Acidimicrobiia bacterium]